MTNKEVDRELSKVIERDYEWLLSNVSYNITKGKMSEYNVELLHFIILELYDKEPQYKSQLLKNGKVKYWIITSAGLQLRSSTSPFYRQIRKTRMSVREHPPELFYEAYDPTMWDCYESGMKEIGWYHRHLLTEKYINKLTFNEIHQKYAISKVHLKRDVHDALEMMRKHCKDI